MVVENKMEFDEILKMDVKQAFQEQEKYWVEEYFDLLNSLDKLRSSITTTDLRKKEMDKTLDLNFKLFADGTAKILNVETSKINQIMNDFTKSFMEKEEDIGQVVDMLFDSLSILKKEKGLNNIDDFPPQELYDFLIMRERVLNNLKKIV